MPITLRIATFNLENLDDKPGQKPTLAMLSLSTCATPEDHAAGNYWHDHLGNPEHRINKIATLTSTRAA